MTAMKNGKISFHVIIIEGKTVKGKLFFQEFHKKARKSSGLGIYKWTKAVYNMKREVTEDVTSAL